ncbi:MAG: hypothetical protein ABSF29_03675 [Tepidisphaeraceae bacterium]|jgi:hypothetical protein
MRRHRHIIAVTLLATALCADRMCLAAPAQRPTPEMSGGIMKRLTVSLRRAMPPLRLYQPPAIASKTEIAPSPEPRPIPVAAVIQLSPFNFRLPPPLN